MFRQTNSGGYMKGKSLAARAVIQKIKDAHPGSSWKRGKLVIDGQEVPNVPSIDEIRKKHRPVSSRERIARLREQSERHKHEKSNSLRMSLFQSIR